MAVTEAVAERSSVPVALVGPVLIGLVAGLGAAMLLNLAPNFDNAWLQEAARRIFLQGGTFERDALEVNPPLAVAVFAPSAFIEAWTGWNADRVYQMLALLGTTLGALFVLPALTWLLGTPLRAAIASAFALAIQVFGSTTLFGERDPMALSFAWPFLVWFATRLAGREAPTTALTILTAMMAALGILLKPTTVLVPALLLGLWVWRERRFLALFEVHFVAMLGVALAYLAAIPLLFPSWLPVGILGTDVYWAYTETLPTVVWALLPDLIQIGMIGLLLALPGPSRPLRYVGALLLAVAFGYQLSALIQMKGWVYHPLPGRQLASITAMLLLLGAGWPARGRLLAMLFASLLMLWAPLMGARFLGAFTTSGNVSGFFNDRLARTSMHRHLAEAATYGPLVVLSTSLLPPWPSVSVVGAEWASRGPCDWIAPAIIRLRADGSPDALREAARLYAIGAGLIAEDLERWKPSVVVVRSKPPPWHPSPGNLIEFYGNDPRVPAAFAGYRKAKVDGIWEYYVRAGSPADRPDVFTRL